MIRKILIAIGISSLAILAGCQDNAQIASENLIKAADNFEINRKIVFINGITDEYLLEIQGRCSMDLNQNGTAFNAICLVGPNQFKRHTLVLSDNTFAVIEQVDPVEASAYHYRVTFKPQQFIPDIDFSGDANELIKNRN